jgi:molybdate transport system permease protein
MLTPEEMSALQLSVLVSSVAVLISTPFAVAVGYFLARTAWRGRWSVETIVNLPLVLPPVVTGYLLLVLLGRNGPIGGALDAVFGVRVVFAWSGAAIAAGVVGFPLMVRAARLGFESVDPRLAVAARSLGAGRLRAFVTVSLPLAAGGVIAGAVLGFARALGEFGATIMVAGNIPGQTQTIPLLIYSNAQRPDGLGGSWRLVAISVVIAAVALVLSEFMERRARRDRDVAR